MSDASNADAIGGAVVQADCIETPEQAAAALPVTQSKWFKMRERYATLNRYLKSEATHNKWFEMRKKGVFVGRYLLESEVHTYAFSVAANAIISFIPFVVLLYKLSHWVFHSPAMAEVVTEAVGYYLPSTAKAEIVNSGFGLEALASSHGVTAFSLIMILISCTGIFLPLEVALNQAWGIAKSRNYIMNQVISFGLAIVMTIVAMISIVLSAWQRQVLAFVFFQHTNNFIYHGIGDIWRNLCTGAAAILFFFSVYWLLPNHRISPRRVLRTSIVTGIIWLVSRYIFVAILPHMDLYSLYGRWFFISVGVLIWSYVSGLILFAGAQFSVSHDSEEKN